MENIIKTYETEEIAVTWKPSLCSHSTNCWKGLSEVFNPRLKPWVDLTKSDADKIMKQIDLCPSAALSYVKKSAQSTAENQTESTEETIVEIVPNGPVLVYGNITVKDTAGNLTSKNKVSAFCRCGASSNKPYCDGTHRKIDFKDPQ